MLILSRKINESIVIDGRIVVKVVRVEGDSVKIGIEAPPDVPVHRKEIYEEIQRSNQQAVTSATAPLPKLPSSILSPSTDKQPPTSGPVPQVSFTQTQNSDQQKTP